MPPHPLDVNFNRPELKYFCLSPIIESKAIINVPYHQRDPLP